MRRTKGFKTGERKKLKEIICEKTGYYIRSNCLLNQAFTRSSYAIEQGGEDNEVLEFIGDQVLNYYVVKVIAEHYGAFNNECEYKFRIRENRFTAIKQEFISNENLAKIIDEWGLIDYLIVGKSDYLNEVDKQEKVKADLFEALLGAIAVESKWDSNILEKAVSRMISIDEKINFMIETDCRPVQFDIENAVNTLKELAEHGGCMIPVYEYGAPEQLGYDKDGNPKWSCTCTIINEGIRRQVWSSSKKSAKKAAAYLVLCEHFGLQNQYGSNSIRHIWEYKCGKLVPEEIQRKSN